MNPEFDNIINGYWLPTVIFKKELNFDRQKLFLHHNKLQIDTRPFFFPLSSLPMFKTCKKNKTAYDLYNRGINLPSYHDLRDEEIDFVSNSIKSFLIS
jgi:perosamine synthetase